MLWNTHQSLADDKGLSKPKNPLYLGQVIHPSENRATLDRQANEEKQHFLRDISNWKKCKAGPLLM